MPSPAEENEMLKAKEESKNNLNTFLASTDKTGLVDNTNCDVKIITEERYEMLITIYLISIYLIQDNKLQYQQYR